MVKKSPNLTLCGNSALLIHFLYIVGNLHCHSVTIDIMIWPPIYSWTNECEQTHIALHAIAMNNVNQTEL